MTKDEYEAIKTNQALWNALRALDFEIHKLPADVRRKLLDMQTDLREIAWNHLQSLNIEWPDKAGGGK